MAAIHLLSSETINRIAAGEVVERPSGVVKELAENSIDAGARAITIEIRGGGIDLIRVTDNGCGIEASEVAGAFRRHATSKIDDAEDLTRLHSLGFRGEALSSIAAVADVEMITRTPEAFSAVRALSSPREPASGDSMSDADKASEPALDITEIGAPPGTTVIVRNLFCSVPVRRKFLKTPQTEAGYITDLISSLALSHPEISFHYRKDGQEKLHTTGNGDIRELIYRIYGRETVRAVVEFSAKEEESGLSAHGYLGRPELSRSTRGSELFFVNGRILSSDVLSRGLEEGYRTDLMQHRFPFAMVWLEIPPEAIDVNIHPSKREIRFTDPRHVYDFLNESVHAALRREELIPRANLDTRAEEASSLREQERAREVSQSLQLHIEPFERGIPGEEPSADSDAALPTELNKADRSIMPESDKTDLLRENAAVYGTHTSDSTRFEEDDFTFVDKTAGYEQQSLFASLPVLPDEKTARDAQNRRAETLLSGKNPFDPADAGALSGVLSEADAERTESCSDEAHILTPENVHSFRYVGQVFGTYWIIEFQNKMLMIDQHAAHEKVNFERLMHRLAKEQQEPAASQMLSPPIIMNLSGQEEAAYEQYEEYFRRMGYEIEPFGERSYAIRCVPLELYANEPDALLRQTLDEIVDSKLSGTPSAILYKIASMSCKAAVKGNMRLSQKEAEDLIEEMLQCDNPYHCPHGRPTMIVMAQSEIDRKFKRIV